MKIEAIVCYDQNYGISKDGKLPWLADGLGDLEYVRITTTMTSLNKKNVLIVGSKTANTLNSDFYNNSNREVWCLTRTTREDTEDSNITYFTNPKELYKSLLNRYYYSGDIDKVFVFGGSEIYKIFIENRWIHKLHVTNIHKDYTCDTLFPYKELVENYTISTSSSRDKKGLRTFEVWERNYSPEYSYLELLENVFFTGCKRDTRNGVTYSKFGEVVEFDIGNYGFPLLTTKKMFFKGISEELFWFFKADTNANHLKQKGVHIWDGNTTKEFLDNLGLDYPEGMAGPIYGFQWRNFNGEYTPGVPIQFETSNDQLYNCLKELRDNSSSRRILFSGWNPNQLHQMCLAPCHVLYQFYVEDGKISCQLYQRSADLFLGLPFNIASVALLTSIFGSMTGYTPGKIRICIGDAHIYEEHRECVLEQLTRTPKDFCKLSIETIREKLEEWCYDDIKIENYVSHGALKAVMKA
jgi:thymidylate synthase